MPPEGLNRRAPAPLRRPAVQSAPPARGVGATRSGPNPIDLQLRLGNRGTQAFLEQFAPARAGGPRNSETPPAAQAPAAAAGLSEAEHDVPRAAAKSAAASVASPAQEVQPEAIAEQTSAAQSMVAAEKAPAQAMPSAAASSAAQANGAAVAADAPAAAAEASAVQGAAPAAAAAAENIAALETPAETEAPAEAAVALSPRQAIAPAAAAIGARSRAAQAHPPAGAASAAAQAGAITPATEQQREADAATMANFSSAADKPAEVDRDDFRAKLKAAILSKMQTPHTEDEAETVMHEGARNASGALQGELHGQSAKAAGLIAAAADPAADVKPADMTVDAAAPLVPEQAGAPPAPVAPDSVVPPPLPAERLDYSSERGDTDRAMAENQVTSEQMQRSNEPQFSAVVQERQGVEAREAQMPGELRAGEAGVRDQAHAGAAQAIVQGLGGMHDNRTARVANVAGQQTTTRDADAAERTRITGELERIKGETRSDVEIILRDMEKDAGEMFDAGLGRAEKAYSDVFDEEKGGVGTWLTTWGDDWEELIEHSLATAKVAYDDEVSRTIDAVATYVEGKLAEAKARVQRGKAEVDQFVAGLDKSVAQFGQEASANIAADFEAMTGEIDQRRDRLVDGLVQKFSESQKRVAALEQKLREENKSLWQRIYDATVGVIKTIIAFKNMLLDVLARAAGVIGAIISDPIGFLGNLIDGVKAGLDQFVGNIEAHLKEGLMGWLFGALEGAGIQLPETFDLKGILSIVLQVLGLTYTNIRARAVRLVGEETVSRLEQVAEVFKILVTEGPAGLWQMLVEKLGNIKDMMLEQIRNWVIEKIIKAGILWLVSLLNPASAFVKACKAIYDIVMFFIERGKQILDLVNAILDTISSIVSGNIQAMADKVEGALARMIPVAISFLASLLGLGGISEKIREIIETIQKPVNAAIDWVIGKAVALAKSVGSLFKGGKKDQEPKTIAPKAANDDGAIQYTATLSMSGAGHELVVEERAGALYVGMASGRLQNLVMLIAEAQAETEDESLDRALEEIAQELVLLDGAWKEIESLPAEELEGKRKVFRQRVVNDVSKLTTRLVGLGTRFHLTSLSDLGNPSTYQSGGFIKEKHRSDIRAIFYRSHYSSDAETERDDYIDSFNDPAYPGKFIDQKTNTWEDKKEKSIDHVIPVVVHWNDHDGNNMNQTARLTWYSEIDNHRYVAKKHNSSDGAKLGITYTWEIGPNFRGPGEDSL
jgi:hypothetical protein